ncbi:MAG: hypothetical protein A4E28_03224 [Methanocella sp. PtaU1.Bin125]|nr:MAG: hypothetical protein A4E28_03224 [Methanocella sp. PtaU1.Bin125]
MADREKIKAFVQDVLGCGCAEEVFKVIELRHKRKGDVKYDRINIGNRLLVYVLRADDPAFIGEELPGMLSEGLKERDSGGFNRFRLVLATGVPSAGVAATNAYKATGLADDRLFLHVVHPAQIKF